MSFEEKLTKVLANFLVFLLVAMVINVLLQVLARFIGFAMPFTEELAGYLLVWVGVLGASYATGQRLHLAIDLWPRSASEAKQKRFNVIVNIIVIIFAFFVMVVGGLNLVYITLKLNQLSPVLEIPKGFVYMVIPLSGLLIIYYSIMNMRRNPYGSY
ncbi:MAG: TRAP transporter small permease [Cyclobacteriaceae bacterium]